MIGAGLNLAAFGVNAKVTPYTNACIPRPGEIEAIAEPLARIVGRHTPDGGGASADVVDGMTAAFGVVEYGIRAATTHAELAGPGQQAAQNAAAAQGPPPSPGAGIE